MTSFQIYHRGEPTEGYVSSPTEEGALAFVVKTQLYLNNHLKAEARVHADEISLIPVPEPGQSVQ